MRQPKPKIELNYDFISEVEVDGINGKDAPDFCDAYICGAQYEGRDMTEDELEVLNQDSDYVYECVLERLY